MYYFLLGDDAFALMPWDGETLQQRKLTSEEKWVVEKTFGILVNRLKVVLGTMKQRPKVVRDIVLTCVVLHNMMRTQQG